MQVAHLVAARLVEQAARLLAAQLLVAWLKERLQEKSGCLSFQL